MCLQVLKLDEDVLADQDVQHCRVVQTLVVVEIETPRRQGLSEPVRNRRNMGEPPTCNRPFITPQSVWPPMTMPVTFRMATANSMPEVTPPAGNRYAGTMYPALRIPKISSGSDWVNRVGLTRESA